MQLNEIKLRVEEAAINLLLFSHSVGYILIEWSPSFPASQSQLPNIPGALCRSINIF